MADNLNQSDHDTLIEIRTKLDLLHSEVRKGNDDTGAQLIRLDEGKVGREQFNTFLIGDTSFKKDHETRVRRLEMWGAMAIGGAYVLMAILHFLR